MKHLSWKLLMTIIITCASLLIISPNFFDLTKYPWLPHKTINLGLDLKGGSHLLLKVDFQNYISEQLNFTAETLRKKLREQKLSYSNFQVSNQNIKFQLDDNVKLEQIKNITHNINRKLVVSNEGQVFEVNFDQKGVEELKQQVIGQTIEIIRLRIDATGTTEPVIQKYGSNNILLEVPGVEDPEQIKQRIGKVAKLTFHIVNENTNMTESNSVPPGWKLLEGEYHKQKYYLLIKSQPEIGGDLLKSAYTTFNNQSQPAIAFAFNSIGTRIFGEVTKKYKGKRLAIVLDNKILSAPVINEPILGGEGIIQGNFSLEEASELALLLRAGSLPAPIKIIEERSIGPSLGIDSIEHGKKAALIGFILVVIFMICVYGIWGIFASIALVLSLLYIFAVLSLLQATLTLPGIAGIILTIGMAVDANVLIYERIREELYKGSSILYSIKEGFRSAFSTIADSNVTTLIASVILYMLGTGAIKGFAITLSIGIVASMYSAVIITKLLIDSFNKKYSFNFKK